MQKGQHLIYCTNFVQYLQQPYILRPRNVTLGTQTTLSCSLLLAGCTHKHIRNPI